MRINHQTLRRIAHRILHAGGSSEAEAATVADNLVEANLSGHDSHGVGLLVAYCRNLEAGTLHPNRHANIVTEAGSFAVWDGGGGYGQVIAAEAMQWAIETARLHGVAVHALRNTHHIGRVGTYGEMAARAGLVSLHFVNAVAGPPPVAPFAGKDGRFATNPICIAIPGTDKTAPLILDFATSRIALGKVDVAHNAGKTVVAGALMDADGRPTTDPGVMFRQPRGRAFPFGEHKGSGLALICEILAGAVAGAGANRTDDPPPHGILNGMLSIVLDPTRLSSRAFIEAEIDGLVDYVKSAAPLDPDRPVLVAGEPERIARADRLANGIEIDATTWANIRDAAAKLQVAIGPDD